MTVAFALAIVSCDIVEEPSVKPPGDPTSDLEGIRNPSEDARYIFENNQ